MAICFVQTQVQICLSWEIHFWLNLIPRPIILKSKNGYQKNHICLTPVLGLFIIESKNGYWQIQLCYTPISSLFTLKPKNGSWKIDSC